MGLSKKQRLEKQRKLRLRRMAKAKVVFHTPVPASRPSTLPDVGQWRIVQAAKGTWRGLQAAVFLTAWLAILPFHYAGLAVSNGLQYAVQPFDVAGTAVTRFVYYALFESWKAGAKQEPEWLKRMEKLEKEVARLKAEVKKVRKQASAAPPTVVAKASSKKSVVAAPPAAPPMMMAPPPPPPMGLPPPPMTPGKLVFKRPAAKPKKQQAAPSAGISLASLLDAKGGLKKNSRPLAALGPKARNGMPAISLKDISNVQLKKTARTTENAKNGSRKPTSPMVVQLRKTQIQRSPGGTPMRQPVRKALDNSTNIISSALKSKFKSLRVKSPRSASPGSASESDTEEYCSPYRPRPTSRLAVR